MEAVCLFAVLGAWCGTCLCCHYPKVSELSAAWSCIYPWSGAHRWHSTACLLLLLTAITHAVMQHKWDVLVWSPVSNSFAVQQTEHQVIFKELNEDQREKVQLIACHLKVCSTVSSPIAFYHSDNQKTRVCKKCESEYFCFGSRNNRLHLQNLLSHLFCLTGFLPKPDIYCVLFRKHQVCTQ